MIIFQKDFIFLEHEVTFFIDNWFHVKDEDGYLDIPFQLFGFRISDCGFNILIINLGIGLSWY